MSEHEYLIAMSVMVKEIDSLRYQVDYLTEENRKLRESQIENLTATISISKGDTK